MRELRMVEVNASAAPLATNPDLTLYQATNYGGFAGQHFFGVLVMFDSCEDRERWMQGRP